MVKKVIKKKTILKEVKNEKSRETSKGKRVCLFCQTKTLPSYIDSSNLRRFFTDRGRILPKAKSGLCSKHQRSVTKQIKYARHLALLPFTLRV